MANEIIKKILKADSFKESLKTLAALSEVCDKFGISAIAVMKTSHYSYCERIALEIGISYQTVRTIVWSLWESEL